MKTSILSTFAFSSLALAQTPSLAELIQSQPDLSTLADALSLVPSFVTLASGLTNITILAPTNAAFEALLAGGPSAESQAVSSGDPDEVSALLAYHVINGTYTSSDFTDTATYYHTFYDSSVVDAAKTNVTGGQNVGLVLNGTNATILSGVLEFSNVVEADITTIPGVTIHKIDQVLTIPLNASTTLSDLSQSGTSAILGALTTADLVDTVDTLQDITVFVPNDDAFAAIASTIQNASVETLQTVLTYHVVQGSVVFANEITNGTVQSVQGNDLTLSVGTDGTVYINNARVLIPNILLSNGVAHVIDAVLNPESPSTNGTNPTPTGPSGTATPTGPTPTMFTGAAAKNKLGEGLVGGALLGLLVGLVL